MKEKIIKALVSGAIGILTSVAAIYLGASTAEAVTVSGVAASALGERASGIAMSVFALPT